MSHGSKNYPSLLHEREGYGVACQQIIASLFAERLAINYSG